MSADVGPASSNASTGTILVSPVFIVPPSTEETCWVLAIKIFNTTMTKDPNKMIVSSSPSPAIVPMTFASILQTAQDARAGHDIKRSNFRSRMEKLVTILDLYAKPIDVMIQHQPHVTALVWGSIRTLLAIAAKEIEICDEIGTALVKIVNEIGRWERYLQIFKDVQRFRTTAAELFAHVINYLVRATAYYNEPLSIRYARAALAPNRNKLHRVLTDIDRLALQLEKEAGLASEEHLLVDRQERQAHYSVAQQKLLEQQAFGSDMRSFLTANASCQSAININLKTLQATLQRLLDSQLEHFSMDSLESQKQSILDWLGGVAITANACISAKASGTCEWIFRHVDYDNWASQGHRSMLWIYGIPGCGKSVLANFLVHSAQTPLVLAHFFRASTNESSTRAISLVASLLFQWLQNQDILEEQHYAAVLRLLRPLLANFRTYAECPFTKLWPILECALELAPEFTLVVDALDESRTDDESFDLWRRLNVVGLFKNSRVVLLSRYQDDLGKCLSEKFELKMDAHTVTPDILLFVQEEIQKIPTLQSLEGEIIHKILADADGMFLWARMMINYLKLATSSRGQKERLRRFPKGLAAIYQKFLEETAISLDRHERIMRMKVFRLLVCAKRPLSVQEISSALALRKPNTHIVGEDLLLDPSLQIHRFCWPLATIVNSHAILIHKSVRDFLLGHEEASNDSMRLVELECEEFMSRVCLYRLINEDLIRDDIIRPIFENTLLATSAKEVVPFLLPNEWSMYSYACEYWHHHVSRASPSIALLSLVAKFLACKEFVIWSECFLQQREDMGPILETQATLRAWHSTLVPASRALIPMNLFFQGPYEDVFDERHLIVADRHLAYTVLRRLGVFYNLAAYDKPVRAVRKQVMEGFREVLGAQHLVTLRAVTEYLIDEIHPYATPALEKALRVNLETQRQLCSEDSSDSHCTGLVLGLCQFSLMKYRRASEVLRQSAEGMRRILGPMNREYLKARMNFGKSLEYLGHVEQAIDIFSGIYNNWKDINGPENPLSLFSQSCLAMALRKAGRYEESEHHTMQCLALRQRIFGMASCTLDTVLHAVVIFREMDRKEEAFAYLDLGAPYVGDGTHPDIGVERAHQVQHIRALLHLDLGDSARATRILEDVFIEVRNRDLLECGELMWMRLTLANILREHDASEAAEALFIGLVKSINTASSTCENDESAQSIIVEGAIRLAQQHDLNSSYGYLKQNGLEWRQENIFRVNLGGPYVETEWHPPVSHVSEDPLSSTETVQ